MTYEEIINDLYKLSWLKCKICNGKINQFMSNMNHAYSYVCENYKSSSEHYRGSLLYLRDGYDYNLRSRIFDYALKLEKEVSNDE